MWRIELLGETFTELGCVPSIGEKIEDVTGLRWSGVGITMARGEVKAIRRTAAVLLADRLGCELKVAYEKIDTLSITELLESVSDVDDELPTVLENGFPQSADEISTTG